MSILVKAIKDIPDIKLKMKILALTNLNKQRVLLEEQMVKKIDSVQQKYWKEFKPFILKQNQIIEGDL